MMTYLLLKPALLLLLLFTLTVGVIAGRPYDEHGLTTDLMPSDDCPAPCWQGIRPGVTSAREAIDLLETHPWIDHVIVSERFAATRRGYIGWAWNGEQPTWVDKRQGGLLWIRDDLVQSIWMATTIRLGDLWLSLNTPPRGQVKVEVNLNAPGWLLIHEAAYPQHWLIARHVIRCPLDPAQFWGAMSDIRIGEVSTAEYGEYKMQNWERNCR